MGAVGADPLESNAHLLVGVVVQADPVLDPLAGRWIQPADRRANVLPAAFCAAVCGGADLYLDLVWAV
jgi:hypothetical protein